MRALGTREREEENDVKQRMEKIARRSIPQKVKCVGEKNIEEKRVCMQCGVSELVHIITGLIIPHLIYGVTVYKAIFGKENLKW